MKDCVDAGIDFYRFSFIGYDPAKYDEWMYNTIGSNCNHIVNNISEMKK